MRWSTAVVVAVAVLAASCELLGGDPYAASPWAGAEPVDEAALLVVLCHGADQSWPEAFDPSYVEAQFTETDGSSTIADYWRDISHGRFSIAGSRVVRAQLDVPSDAIADRTLDDWRQCRDGAVAQHDLELVGFDGTVVLKPQTYGELVEAVDEDDTRLRVRPQGHSVAADWPAPPFLLVVTRNGSLWRDRATEIENVVVTDAVAGDDGTTTFTVERAQARGDRGTTAKAFDAGTRVRQVADIFGTPGRLVATVHTSPSTINHELGHLLGWSHSRRLSTATEDYRDCFDIMSAMNCANSHYFLMSTAYAGPDREVAHGLGMTSGHLDRRGWIDRDDRRHLLCGPSETHTLRALGTDGDGLLQVRLPVTVDIRDGVVSRHATIELRSQRFAWDRGIPRDAVVVHLVGNDERVYLVDDAAAGGVRGMVAGDEFTLANVTMTVRSIDAGAGTAEVELVRRDVEDEDCEAGDGGRTGPPGDDEPGGRDDAEDPAPDPAPSPTPTATPDDAVRECFETPGGRSYPFPLPDGATYVGEADGGLVDRYLVPGFDAAVAHIVARIAADPDHTQIDDPGISRVGDLRDEGFTLVGPCYELVGGFSVLEQEDGSITLDVIDIG